MQNYLKIYSKLFVAALLLTTSVHADDAEVSAETTFQLYNYEANGQKCLVVFTANDQDSSVNGIFYACLNGTLTPVDLTDNEFITALETMRLSSALFLNGKDLIEQILGQVYTLRDLNTLATKVYAIVPLTQDLARLQPTAILDDTARAQWVAGALKKVLGLLKKSDKSPDLPKSADGTLNLRQLGPRWSQDEQFLVITKKAIDGQEMVQIKRMIAPLEGLAGEIKIQKVLVSLDEFIDTLVELIKKNQVK